ncbi:acyltransferase family protein [Chloroflexota bacterium]
MRNLAVTTNRLYYIDWLRVLAMITIFFFHNSRLFDEYGWHIKNVGTSIVADIWVDFCNPWLMPLFFILAGASIFYAFKSRTPGGFAKERMLRLLIPLVILGWFIIAPPQIFLERLSNGAFSGNFFQFYSSQYFNGFYGLGGNFGLVPLHMWFLWLLFIYSLVLIPFFITKKGTRVSLLSRFAILFEKPWILLAPVLLISVSEISLDSLGDMLSWGGGWNHLSYLVFFISGYLVFSNTQIQDNIKKYALKSLIVYLVLQAVHYLLMSGVLTIDFGDYGNLIYRIFITMRSWLFIIAILGFSSRYLNFNNRFLRYTNEAVLPFYILHQTVIIVIGYFVIQLSTGILPKYLITITTSFIAIMLIYELLVRRINILRFLFGMRWKKERFYIA